ncbi:unnamed protein product [Knipowitschia caucasica]|uniref:RUS family member 1 n=1 Tax=Knipowitschia caucasica TaxID=637954 RepID=A0AAV2KCL0_KNICA
MSTGSQGPQLEVLEQYGRSGSVEWCYRVEGEGVQRQRLDQDLRPGPRPETGLLRLFKSVFLPQGFPHSVSEDYVQYQVWDTAQAFCSSLSGTLATQASLRGVGVGDQKATVAAATTTWLLRDGTGMLGRILFAWKKGTKLDSEAKKWRLFADFLNDVALFMEILAPFFPTFFLWIVCTAGVFKSIVGVAGGATRAALTVHQARRDNMADISAKDGSQETLVNLAGLLVSLLLIPLVTDNPPLTLLLFSLFTVLHLVANFKAVRSVVMETFNEERLQVVWTNFVQTGKILTPREANAVEPLLNWCSGTVPVRLGVKLQELRLSAEHFQRLTQAVQQRRFLIAVRDGCVFVVLLIGASVTDELQSMCQCLSLRNLMTQRHTYDQWQLLEQSRQQLDKHFPSFLKSLENTQWETHRNLLDADEWRLDFKSKHN